MVEDWSRIVLDFTAFLTVLVLVAASLVRSILDPVGFDRRWYAAVEAPRGEMHRRYSSVRFLLLSTAFAVAALRAELPVFWGFASLFFLALAWQTRGAEGQPSADSPPVDDPPPSRIPPLMRFQVVQFAVLTLWVYSWRGLAA